jgi:hypothetical protein
MNRIKPPAVNCGLKLSPMLRLAAKTMEQFHKLNEIAKGLAADVASNPEIANSLRVPNQSGTTIMRPADIKATPDGDPIILGYVYWDDEMQIWGVLLELPSEKHFASREVRAELN